MIEKLLEEYYKLVEAKELLDYLVIHCDVGRIVSQAASIKLDKFYGCYNDE